jgi:hypothetical protein
MLFVECNGTPYEVCGTRDVTTAHHHERTRQRPRSLLMIVHRLATNTVKLLSYR